jgi:hypothetical protein
MFSSSLGTVASDVSVPLVRKISGRPCVGGHHGRAAHQRRKNVIIKHTPAEGCPLVPGSSNRIPGTQGLPGILRPAGIDGLGAELTCGQEGGFRHSPEPPLLFSWIGGPGGRPGWRSMLKPDEPNFGGWLAGGIPITPLFHCSSVPRGLVTCSLTI